MPDAAQTIHFTPPQNHRFLLLDALRGIAALLVVLYHLSEMVKLHIAPNGFLAVDFFFCLSGFVIAFSYERRLAEQLSFRDFFVARLVRLYPVYFICSLLGLLIKLVLQRAATHEAPNWSSWSKYALLALFMWPTCLTSIHSPDNFPLNVSAWSLFYELVANFAFATLVKIRAAKSIVIIGILIVSFLLLARLALHGGSINVGFAPSDFGPVFARVAFSFCAGVLVFRIYHSRPHIHLAAAPTRIFAAIAISFAVIGILGSSLAFMQTERFHLITVVLFFPMLIYAGATVRLPHAFARACTVLGELSYPLYLLHMPLISPFVAQRFARFAAHHIDLTNLLIPVLLVVLATVAWLLGEYVDVPIRRSLTRSYNSLKKPKTVAL
jgi:peptidoglycan/LPS O-acetylase OafA/YrhL